MQERDAIVPLLAVFASLFCYLLVTIHDTECYGDDVGSGANIKIWMPFTLSELVPMSLSLRDVTLGLIELAFPQSRPAVREEYQLAVKSVRSNEENIEASNQTDTQIWSHLFKTTVHLVRQLCTRDTRRQFCPENHWINNRITLPLDRPHDISFRRARLRQYRPFQGLRVFTREELGKKKSLVYSPSGFAGNGQIRNILKMHTAISITSLKTDNGSLCEL